MVVAERWSEQRVLMRAYAQSRDQSRPTIVLHGMEVAIGPAGVDSNGEWGLHVQPPVDGNAQYLKTQLELAARRLSGSKGNPPRLLDEESDLERKVTNTWAPGSPRDRAEAPISSRAWEPATASHAGASAYARTSFAGAGSVDRVEVAEQPPATGGRTALGYSSGAGAQNAVIRLGLRPAAASRLGRIGDRTVPADFQVSPLERDVLNALGESDQLSARTIGGLIAMTDAVTWMERLIVKLERFGLDIVGPGEPEGSEPTYVLRR